jgi:uncharacterized protein involved in exopolysaccharide biosynthesis
MSPDATNLPKEADELDQSGKVNEGGLYLSCGRRVYRCRWRWIVTALLCILLALLSAALVWMSVRPKYEAAAWLQILGSPPMVAFSLPDSQDRTGAFVQTQIELMKSPIVLAPVLSKPEIAQVPEIARQPDKVRWLAENLLVRQVGESDLYTVSFVCSDPARSAAVVNEVVDTYFRHHELRDSARVNTTLRLLEEERVARQAEVTRLHEQVRELTKAATGKDPFAAIQEPDPSRPGPLADLQKRLAEVQVDRQVLESEVRVLEELPAKQAPSVPQSLIEQELEQNQELRARRDALVAARLQLEELKKGVVRDDHPEYKKRLAEVREQEAMLESAKAAFRQQVSGDLAKTVALRRADQLAEKRQQLEALQTREHLLQTQVDRERQNLGGGTGNMLPVLFKRAELEQAQRVLDLIASRLAQIHTEQKAPSRVSKLRAAELPDAPLPFPYYILAIASACGLVLPIAGCVLWSVMARPRRTTAPAAPLPPAPTPAG